MQHRTSSVFFLGLLVGGCASAAVPGEPWPRVEPLASARVEPPAPRTEEFGFLVAADTHALRRAGQDGVTENPEFVRNIDWLNRLGGDFLIVLGDVVDGYSDPAVLAKMWSGFDQLAHRMSRPIYTVPGNHDIYDPSSEQAWRTRYGSPYRSFDHRGSHFVLLDSEDLARPLAVAGPQLAWLAEDLEQHARANRIFVFIHRPLWGEAKEAWNRDVHPLLARYGVDTVFAGHWHDYSSYPIRDGVHYVSVGSLGGDLGEGIGELRTVLPVVVGDRASQYRVLLPSGESLPAAVVRQDLLEQTGQMLRILPPAAISRQGDVAVKLELKNPLDVAITGHASLDAAGTSWRSEPAELSVPPHGQTTVELSATVSGSLFPLPRGEVRLVAGESRLVQRRFWPDVSRLGSRLRFRLLDDFEDGDLVNRAAREGIAAAGKWSAAVDAYGHSTLGSLGVARAPGGSGRALHLSGYHGKSEAPNWCWATLTSALLGATGRPTKLADSQGIVFRARSDQDNLVWVSVEATVAGKRLAGTGSAHRVELQPTTEWKTYAFFWPEFEQPPWSCPGPQCAEAALTVDQVEGISWVFRDEGRAIDLWLDDVRLVYERP
jgi:predicted phosphodiesterase